MQCNAKLLPTLNMREHSIGPRVLSGNATSNAVNQHRRAISPSAAGELAGMFTTHSPSPIGLSVLIGSQRTTALRQSATRHRQVGRASCGARSTAAALQSSTSIGQNLWKSIQGSVGMQGRSINIHWPSGVFSSALATATSLTGRSRGRSLSPSLRQCLMGAPYLGR